MNAVIPFDFNGAAVRIVMIADDPWFVAKDVCGVLELNNPRSSLALLDDDEKGVHSVDTLGGSQQMAVVNEPGLYRLIGKSRKPNAKQFQRWVYHEVLPSIRKTGSYGAAPAFEIPTTYAEALTARTGWTQASMDACTERCAEFGDPPCWQLPQLTSDAVGEVIAPCVSCQADARPVRGGDMTNPDIGDRSCPGPAFCPCGRLLFWVGGC